MNLLRRVLPLLLTLLTVFSLFSCSLEDAVITPNGAPVPNPNPDQTENAEPLTSNGTYGLTYDEGLDYYVVTGYHGTEADVFIPSEWNGKHVIGINSYAFFENPTVKTVTITSSITSVAKNAFVGDYVVFCEKGKPALCEDDECTALHPEGWHKDWYDKSADPAFVEWGCGSLGSFSWVCNENNDIVITGYIESPVSLNIPERIGSRKVVAIKSDAFTNCSSLEAITLPDSVTEIGSFAFRYCTSLKSIALPRGVTVISSYLFDGCTALEEIIISSSTASISSYSFANCTSLRAISIPASVKSIERNAFLNCNKLTIYVDFEKNDVPSGWLEGWNSGRKVVYKNGNT